MKEVTTKVTTMMMISTPPTCRLKRSGAFRRKVSPPTRIDINPVLPETVDLTRVQDLSDALVLTAPLLPELVDPNRPQHLDLALAELPHEVQEDIHKIPNQEEPPKENNYPSPEPRRSLRLRKENPKFLGKQWNNEINNG